MASRWMPPPFVDSIHITLENTNGPIYQLGDGGERILRTATSATVEFPVPWIIVDRVRLTFRDVAGNSFSSTFVHTNAPATPLQLTTLALPAGVVGTNYVFLLEAGGGLPPYSFSIIEGALPPGLELDPELGLIGGVPETNGLFSLRLQVTDQNSGQSARTFLMTVRQAEPPNAPDVKLYAVLKGQESIQAGPGAPTVDPESPFHFALFVDGRGEGSITNAVVRSPRGATNVLEEQGGPNGSPAADVEIGGQSGSSFKFEQTFGVKTVFDTAFGAGGYSFYIHTAHDGLRTATLTLPPETYPAVPHISNWAAAQAVDPAADFTLTWDAFPGATTNDFVQVQVSGELGNVFETAGPRRPGSLNGRSTGVTIPAGTLPSAGNYEAMVLLAKFVNVNTNAIPGALGLAAYARATRVPLVTGAPPPPQGQIQFSAPSYSISETGAVAQFTVQRVGGASGAVSVSFETSGGSATPDVDYASTAGPIDFADGESTVTLSFDIMDDEIAEPDEIVGLRLSDPTGGAVLGARSNAVMVIVDNDVPGTAGLLQFSLAGVTVSEAGTNVALVVTRTGGHAGIVTVEYITADGSATDGADYTGVTGTLTFADGVLSRVINVPLLGDLLDETNENFVVMLDNPTGGASIGLRNTTTVTITDNDQGGVIRFGAAAYRVDETAEEAAITLVRAEGLAEGVSVDVLLVGGTATVGEDYFGTTFTVEFEAGQTSTSFSIPINDDSLAEGNETVLLQLANPTGGATLGAQTNAVLTLVDDEVTLQLSSATYVVNETASVVVLSVTRSGPSTAAATVDFATVDGTALAGSDYLGTNGTVSFAPGVTTRSFAVRLLTDNAVEGDESFRVELGNPVGAQLGPVDGATVTVTDNDQGGVIGFKLAGFLVRENGRFANIQVTRTGGRAAGVTVDFGTSDGSATAGLDYTGVEQTLSFNAGESVLTVQIPILNDALDETNETVHLTLTNPQGRRRGSPHRRSRRRAAHRVRGCPWQSAASRRSRR